MKELRQFFVATTRAGKSTGALPPGDTDTAHGAGEEDQEG